VHGVRSSLRLAVAVGYAMTAAALSDVSNGRKCIRTLHLTSPRILDDPEFVSVHEWY